MSLEKTRLEWAARPGRSVRSDRKRASLEMIHAAATGQTDHVRCVLAAATPSAQALNEAFRRAVMGGHTAVFSLMLPMVDIHAADEAALRLASARGHIVMTRALLTAGADIHAVDDAPMCNAAQYGHLDVAKMLLEKGAHINAGGGMPLRAAALGNHIDMARLILAHGACLAALSPGRLPRPGATFWPPWEGGLLAATALRGHVPMVRFLVGAGLDPVMAWHEANDAAASVRHAIAASLDACDDVMTEAARTSLAAIPSWFPVIASHAASRTAHAMLARPRAHDNRGFAIHPAAVVESADFSSGHRPPWMSHG